MNIGQDIPNFTASTQTGEITLHEYFGEGWGILFSHPGDYTPVCTTELGEVQRLAPEFEARNTKVIALSCNDLESHAGWIADIKAATEQDIAYPIIADSSREIAVQMGMLSQDHKDDKGLPLTVRSVFIVSPDHKIKVILTYPASTGRNFNEILRVLDSLQLTATKSLATPVNWVAGEDAVILPSISDEDATTKFPLGFRTLELPSGKKYLRFTPTKEASPEDDEKEEETKACKKKCTIM